MRSTLFTAALFLLIVVQTACTVGTIASADCDPKTDRSCACSDADGRRCDPDTDLRCDCRLVDGVIGGDTGRSCDPDGPDGQCNFYCLGRGDGTGSCVELCGDSGGNVCVGEFACNTVQGSDGAPFEVCLPNASCGDLDFRGRCDGDDLVYCDTEGPVTIPCGASMAEDGQPLRCAEVSQEYGHDCVAGGFSGGCGAETLAGRCEGNAVVYCVSLESGDVERLECPAGQECGVSADGLAGCRVPGSDGCGSVTYVGYCDGTTAVWCDTGLTQLQSYDCAESNQTCGWTDEETGYWCVNATTSSGTYNVSGTFRFEKPALTRNGLGAATAVPVRQALVQVRRASDNTVLASNTTDEQGRFSVGFEASETVYVAVLAAVESDRYGISVRDCPTGSCGGLGNIYAAASEDFAADAATSLGTLTIPRDGVAGAFNIFDVLVRGFDFAWEQLGAKPPSMMAQWKPRTDTLCGTSCFSAQGNTIYVLSTATDTDEFDDPVLGHEFGHFLESAFSQTSSPGGFHDGSPTDPRLAWGEGYGTWVGSSLFESPIYVDSFASGSAVTDISNTGVRADANASRGMSQLLSEYMVAEILWTIGRGGRSTEALGEGAIFDVLSQYFRGSQFADRAVGGVDLVDFLDGWFCRGHGEEPTMRTIVNDERRFPYDYSGPTSCR